MRALPASCWTDEIAGDVPATMILVSRWREIEIHRVDLDLGYASPDWPAGFVPYYLPHELAKKPGLRASVCRPGCRITQCSPGWSGRSGPGLPELPAWA
ncbi:hypothetical protein [Amycolatopsis silviterrae]|uniref:Uncharacterized protein n=1 Tax=Amycolatopsis silviterrae TaxID=1656914 RepID=A0ABW5H3S8_9PSEU